MAIVNISDGNDFIAFLAAEWREAKSALVSYEEKEATARQALIDACKGEFEGFGVKVEQITRKGSVNYAAIPELANVSVEQYRKESTTYWSVKPSVKE